MFRLSESDYRRLEPLAMKVYKQSARSANVARLMESRVGRRALVDMMFLERTAWHPDVAQTQRYVAGVNANKRAKEAATDNVYGSYTVTGEETEDAIDKAWIASVEGSKEDQNGTPVITNKKEGYGFFSVQKLSKFISSIMGKNRLQAAELYNNKAALEALTAALAAAEQDSSDLKGVIFKMMDNEKYANQKLLAARKVLFDNLKAVEKNKEALARQMVAIKEITDPAAFAVIADKAKEDARYGRAFISAIENQKMQIDKETEDAIRESLKFKNRVKKFFAKISKWFKGGLDNPLKKIYSFFVEKGEKGITIKWAHIAIVAAVIAVIGFVLFGTSAGQKIKNFVLNAIKAGINGIKSAVRYVLGKGGAPKEVADETEDFLDEATA